MREQTALRRIATSVAADSPPAALFAQVTEEVGRLLGAPNASIVRYEEDASATVVGSWTDSGAGGLPVGTRLPLDGDTVIVRVLRTGQPQRVETTRASAARSRSACARSASAPSVAAPVRVAGRLWGVVVASAHARAPARGRGAAAVRRRRARRPGARERRRARACSPPRGRASCRPATPSAGAWSATCTTGRSSGSCRSRCSCAWSRRSSTRDPGGARADARRRASAELREALEELRELARGIHPAVLTDRGLGPAVAALANRSPVPVEVDRRARRAAARRRSRRPPTTSSPRRSPTSPSTPARPTSPCRMRDDGRPHRSSRSPTTAWAAPTPPPAPGLRGIADRVEALQVASA